MELRQMALILGGVLGLLGAIALAAPQATTGYLGRFPRLRNEAWVLTAAALVWSGWLVHGYLPDRMARLQPMLFLLVPAAVYLVATYMDELLAPRALGGLLLLVPAPILDIARRSDSPWRLAVVLFAYLLVLAGMTLVLSPHLFRRAALFCTGSPARWRIAGGTVIAGGIAFVVLGLAVY